MCVCSSLSRVVDICPTLYQSQLKQCVMTSLDEPSSDVHQIADRISAVVEKSSLGILVCKIVHEIHKQIHNEYDRNIKEYEK